MLRTAGIDNYNQWITHELPFTHPGQGGHGPGRPDLVHRGLRLRRQHGDRGHPQTTPMDPMFTDDTANPGAGCSSRRPGTARTSSRTSAPAAALAVRDRRGHRPVLLPADRPGPAPRARPRLTPLMVLGDGPRSAPSPSSSPRRLASRPGSKPAAPSRPTRPPRPIGTRPTSSRSRRTSWPTRLSFGFDASDLMPAGRRAGRSGRRWSTGSPTARHRRRAPGDRRQLAARYPLTASNLDLRGASRRRRAPLPAGEEGWMARQPDARVRLSRFCCPSPCCSAWASRPSASWSSSSRRRPEPPRRDLRPASGNTAGATALRAARRPDARQAPARGVALFVGVGGIWLLYTGIERARRPASRRSAATASCPGSSSARPCCCWPSSWSIPPSPPSSRSFRTTRGVTLANWASARHGPDSRYPSQQHHLAGRRHGRRVGPGPAHRGAGRPGQARVAGQDVRLHCRWRSRSSARPSSGASSTRGSRPASRSTAC